MKERRRILLKRFKYAISDISPDILTTQANQSHATTILPQPHISTPIEEIPGDIREEQHTEKQLFDAVDVDTDMFDDDSKINNVEMNTFREISYFVKPSPMSTLPEKLDFMKHHPIQPCESTGINLPFKPFRIYYRSSQDDTVEQRKWLSYCLEYNKIFCSVCMAFSTDKLNPFVLGHKVNVKNIYKDLDVHETSKAHEKASISYLMSKNNADVGTLINKDLMDKRKSEVDTCRKVLTRIIDIVLFLGRQGLAYRGKREEAAADLCNRDVNHGNFLELVMLLCKYDQILHDHVAQAIKKSQEKRSSESMKKSGIEQKEGENENSKRRGRGSLITFLSKSFINKLIAHLAIQIQNNIADEVKQSGSFSIEVDSTQDISVIQQLALCVRYVLHGKVKVRLLKLVDAPKTTGEALYLQIKEELTKFKLPSSQIIGTSFDGAANMSGIYKGLQAQLKKDNPNIQYVHCYAHVLNLILTDATECCKLAKDFLGLMQTTTTFISESYKRMQIWTSVNKESACGNKLLCRLQKVGATRWWSKDRALNSMFDESSKPFKDRHKFLTLLKCLQAIAEMDDFPSHVSFSARSLLDNWCKFQYILIATIFSDLFNISTPASKYLQMSGLDYFTAANKIQTLKSKLLQKRNNFDMILKNASEFVEHLQRQLTEKEYSIEIESCLPEKRIPIAKCRSGEYSYDEARSIAQSPSEVFKVNVYNVILDTAIQQLNTRFTGNDLLLKDIAWLDPRRFSEVKLLNELPEGALSTLSSLAKVEKADVRKELLQFSRHYADYNQSLLQEQYPCSDPSDAYSTETSDSDSSELSKDNENHCKINKKCKKCLVCALELLCELNAFGRIYPTLYIAYKYIFTLSCTQVSCERVFSTLKIIKNRLRSSLGQELLEDFILFNVERSFDYDYDKIIDGVASSSKELSRYLTF